ncbi:hypothetical protein RQM59_07485 [Flavobacteriaceae bacterium S356]|uniref:Transcriptional regulator n=1 Tax=Asprobacillus argus TaxID=3076534 RepID=A0ABU3LF59_9FLAO|nr:hypothetical protein [Flavobacteriaceae bacterium S356]
MENLNLIDQILEFDSQSGRGLHTSDIARIMDNKSKKEIIATRDYLLYKNIFIKDEYGTYRLTPFAREIVSKYGSWSTYVKFLEKETEKQHEKDELDLEKNKVDLELAKQMLKEYPKTKWFARIGFFIAICLAILELIKLFKN